VSGVDAGKSRRIVELWAAFSFSLTAFAGAAAASAPKSRPCAPARQSVALDWSAVSPELLARCHLRGLETLLLQALIERNYAIVGMAGTEDVELTLPSPTTPTPTCSMTWPSRR